LRHHAITPGCNPRPKIFFPWSTTLDPESTATLSFEQETYGAEKENKNYAA
jgi:hypothetical protein